MFGEYSVLDKSMNGVKTLSDGISFIENGNANHNQIIYNQYIKSSDEQTSITNDTITTENINAENISSTNITSGDISSTTLECDYLYVNDVNNILLNVLEVNGNSKTLKLNGTSEFLNTVALTNASLNQTQNGRIYQQGTNSNSLKDTYINGFLSVGSNITQTGGSTSLKDTTTDNLTLRSNKSITQTGTTVSNTLAGTTTIKDLVILDSVVFPSSVTVPGTTTTDDIVMEGDSVIIQDLTTTTTKQNIFRNTKTLDLQVDGNLSQIKGGATATLKNTTIQGTAEIQGDITQTTGASSLRTINCNNITLRDDQNITQSGTGYITQSGTGQNTMKEISLTNNSNLIFNGNGVISQPLNTSVNVLNNFRCAGYGIVGGRNNTTFTNTQNIQNNNGLQLQFNRDNSSQYSFVMNNRGTGGNGGFRFQRYIGGVYLDEPLTIDDNITMNKNLSIPSGSISCSSATLGNISQTEINCLDNCSVNIQTQFNTIDSQIASLQSSSSGNTTALTGISYVSASDTTLIDNNLTISSGKNLLVGTTNVMNSITAINTTISGFSYNSVTDTTSIDNNVNVGTGKSLVIGSTDVGSSINSLNSVTSGITYTSGTDTTTIDNNVTINKTLIVQGMNIKAEIDALDTSFTTGTITSTDLTTTNLNVNNNAKFGQVGGSTFVKNDMLFCNTVNKSESECTQFYQSGSTMNIQNQTTNGGISIQAKNSSGVMTEYMSINSTSLNVKGTNVDIDTNLNVDNTSTFNNGFQSFKIIEPSYSYPKVFGFTNVLVVTITVAENFRQPIIINCPISSYRTGQVNNAGNQCVHDDTLNAVSCSYEITNVQSTSSIPVITNMTLPALKRTRHISPTYGYQQYFTNATVTIPAYLASNTGSLEYKVYFTFAYSYTSNFADIAGTVQAGYSVNTDISNTYYNPALGLVTFDTASGTNYSATSFTVSYKNATYLDNVPSQTKTSILVSNSLLNQNNIETNSVNASSGSITTLSGTMTSLQNIKMRNNVAAYMVRLFSGRTLMYSIPCSMKDIEPFNVDNSWIVYPGFKIVIYDDANYANELQTIINDGTTIGYLNKPINVASSIINRCGSVRLYFRPVASPATLSTGQSPDTVAPGEEEITLPNIS